MAMVDTYLRSIQRKKSELVRLMSDRSKEQTKSSDISQKIGRAKKELNSTKSSSVARSKQSEILRLEKSQVSAIKKCADLEKKIAQKQKEIANEETKYQREKNKIDKKTLDNEKRLRKETDQQMRNISNQVNTQGIDQEIMKDTIKRMQEVPKIITVLFLASNPQEVTQLKLGEEARDIQNKIRSSKHRDSVKFETRWAVRPSDILQAINEVNPTIIHFSGHGSASGELVLQNPDDSLKLVSPEAIAQTINVASDTIRLVFFNACFSSIQSELVVENIEASIGMNASIGDEAARVFAAQFYSAIGFGLSLDTAFRQAKAALMLEGITEEDTPILSLSEGTDPTSVFLVAASDTKD